MPKIGYLTVLYIRLGAKFGDLHTKDSSLFYKQQISLQVSNCKLYSRLQKCLDKFGA